MVGVGVGAGHASDAVEPRGRGKQAAASCCLTLPLARPHAPTQDSGHCGFVAERAELLLRQAGQYGLRSRAQCVEYLGNLFRATLDAPPRKTDYQARGAERGGVGRGGAGRGGAALARSRSSSGNPTHPAPSPASTPSPTRPTPTRRPSLPARQVGEQLLRDLLFIHLDEPVDKLQLGVQMLLKLYALADRQCGEDNPDAPTHHEVLLPGHLLLKFLREQLETALDAFKAQVGQGGRARRARAGAG